MEIKKFSDFEVLQKFTTQYYEMWPADKLRMCKIVGHDGFPEKYRVEIDFQHASYVSIPTDFTNYFEFRNATEEEKKDILSRFDGLVFKGNVYIIEEWKEVERIYHREAIKAFVIASSVMITIYDDYSTQSV